MNRRKFFLALAGVGASGVVLAKTPSEAYGEWMKEQMDNPAHLDTQLSPPRVDADSVKWSNTESSWKEDILGESVEFTKTWDVDSDWKHLKIKAYCRPGWKRDLPLDERISKKSYRLGTLITRKELLEDPSIEQRRISSLRFAMRNTIERCLSDG